MHWPPWGAVAGATSPRGVMYKSGKLEFDTIIELEMEALRSSFNAMILILDAFH